MGWDKLGKNLIFGLPMIGVTYRKTLAVGFAKWKTGQPGNCEGSGILVTAQGPMLGCLRGFQF